MVNKHNTSGDKASWNNIDLYGIWITIQSGCITAIYRIYAGILIDNPGNRIYLLKKITGAHYEEKDRYVIF